VESIDDKAARWAVRAAAGDLSPPEQVALDEWINADPRHRGAYIAARAQWLDLDRLAALHGPAEVQRAPFVSRRQLLAACAAALALTGGAFSWLRYEAGVTRYVSAVGEVRRISLEDGSTLLLNTNTEVKVALGKRERRMYLVRGEALFEVAPDKTRPFVVIANDTAVRAVGTAFAVRLESNRVDVTVTEGVVEVASSNPGPGSDTTESPILVHRLQHVTATERVVIAAARAPQITTLAPNEADRLLAWREGMVSFDGQSLEAAVAEINRHNRRQIVVTDPALAAKPIVGVFRASDPVGFSRAVADVLKATASNDGETIRLEPERAARRKLRLD
jgi:transmembrane sensor